MSGLPALIRGLLEPAAYPERPGSVELRQTHVSYLLFTPEFVYKIKKPVDFGFLDFTTLEARRHFCEEEARLNRRLAPGAYLGVVAVTEQGGRPLMGGDGEPVEYAVKMRRLAEGRSLLSMLRQGLADEGTIRRVAEAIASFHSGAATDGRISGFGSPASIRRNADENFSQTRPFIGKVMSQGLSKTIEDYTTDFLSENEAAFARRALEGFVRDCHGDIHAEHVFVDGKVEIIDCIEFNERFRYSDVVADLAFLSMDLDYANCHPLSVALDEAYFRATGDYKGRRLMDFYRCYRAYVRGKVEGFKALESEVAAPERDEAYIRSVCHFYLAGLYASGGLRPMMLLVCGLSGSGKSTLASAMAERTGFVHISSDRLRKELAGLEPGEKRPEPFGEGLYSEEQTERTYEALLDRGAACLRQGRSVVLDATFGRRRHLQEAAKTASCLGARLRVIECSARNDTVRSRLARRANGPEGGTSDADWEIYLRQKASFEAIIAPRTIVRAEDPPAQALKAAFFEVFG